MFSKQHIKKSLIPHYICNYSLGGLKAAFEKTKSWTNAVFSTVKKNKNPQNCSVSFLCQSQMQTRNKDSVNFASLTHM